MPNRPTHARAHWLRRDLLAWPPSANPTANPTANDGAAWFLHHSPRAELEMGGGAAILGGEAIPLRLDPDGLPLEVRVAFPALADYLALRLPPEVDRVEIAQLLREQLWVSRTLPAGSEGGSPEPGAEPDIPGAQVSGVQVTGVQVTGVQVTGVQVTSVQVTGVQLPGVLDDLYAAAAAAAPLGVVFATATTATTANGVDRGAQRSRIHPVGAVTARLWAPTAQAVALEVAPGGAGDPATLDPATLDPATLDPATGIWSTSTAALQPGDRYRWHVTVYAPTTGEIVTNVVTDPYAVVLTPDAQWAIVTDLADPATRPHEWEATPAPEVPRAVDHAIYELHVRDFSFTDATVPRRHRGTYAAFTHVDSDGMRHLRALAEAGITTIHLLPTFDIASIPPRAAQTGPPTNLAELAKDPASPAPQAAIGAQRHTDGFNWGYDPRHYLAPEGSYAVGHEVALEFRAMVGALHAAGLQVVLDQGYNHTAAAGQHPDAVLDRIVPGYYHRLDADGQIEHSTCCNNTATEHRMMGRLMVDAVVHWARHYRVDGFRFDLMGHHSREAMLAVRAGLDALTIERDGVDGRAIYLYGEGWNFGEVANNALFTQATQGQLDGTGIGTFNDRLRDGVHGGSPTQVTSRFDQGFATGLGTDPSHRNQTPAAELGPLTDVVKLGMAGNLRDFEFVAHDGVVRSGAQVTFRGGPAGYAREPGEVVNYVDAHDNETLFDLFVMKLPRATSMRDRVAMNTLALATVTLGQAVTFWHAGTDLLRSKSLDRDSYDSGDWFNRIDWTGRESAFGSGLPAAWRNQDAWDDLAPLLADPALKPDSTAIALASAQARQLLRVRREVNLLRLGRADLIRAKVSFPGSGPQEPPGTIAMLVDNTVGPAHPARHAAAFVLLNASPAPVVRHLPELAGRAWHPPLAGPAVGHWNDARGEVRIPARSWLVLVSDLD